MYSRVLVEASGGGEAQSLVLGLQTLLVSCLSRLGILYRLAALVGRLYRERSNPQSRSSYCNTKRYGCIPIRYSLYFTWYP